MAAHEEPMHLNNHHRDTVTRLFDHPVGHNIDWRDVRSLLDAVATVEEHHEGHLTVTLGGETKTFERPKHKDISAQQVLDLRRMLTGAGYGGVAHDPEVATEEA
jgi:hypothetical protein